MAKIEVTMPKMGESITEGTVLEWHKQIGDAVEMDETLLEIGTDKVDTEVPSPEAGVLAEILVEEGATVDVGTVIAVLTTDAAEAVSAAPAPEAPAEPVAEATPEPTDATGDASMETSAPVVAEAASQGSSTGTLTDVVMPKMGESITEGTVLVWSKAVGDEIEMDETLLEIGTDKVDTEVPSPVEGVLAEILVEEGETVEVGTVIARIGSEAGAIAAPAPVAAPSPLASAPTPSAPAPTPAAPAASGDGVAADPVPRRDDDGRFYSPLVRSIAETEGLTMQDMAAIQGSGREGRITKEDVMQYLENRGSAPTPVATPAAPAPARAPRPASAPTIVSGDGGRVEIQEMSRMRQIIAEHMVRSKATSAHVTSFAEADVTNLVAFRNRNKAAFQQREGVRLTFTPFFVHAAVEALREHPIMNASVEGTKVLIKKDYHIGIAVAIDKTGLVAPILRNAGQRNLTGLAHSVADLANRARTKQLQPQELQGGTFTVTNVGSLGSIMGTPIISQPQVGILATGAIKKRPVVIEDPVMGDVIAIRHMMYLSLSYDHRIVDGAMGSSFLQKYVSVLESFDPNADL
ncbi:MAG: 2-oxoglutarate dehydrogenase, E2 component, dihydrolipoamide succinyltransferase [Rhodothermales bacterium]